MALQIDEYFRQEEVLAQRLLLLSNIPASMSLMEIRKLVSPFGSLLVGALVEL